MSPSFQKQLVRRADYARWHVPHASAASVMSCSVGLGPNTLCVFCKRWQTDLMAAKIGWQPSPAFTSPSNGSLRSSRPCLSGARPHMASKAYTVHTRLICLNTIIIHFSSMSRFDKYLRGTTSCIDESSCTPWINSFSKVWTWVQH